MDPKMFIGKIRSKLTLSSAFALVLLITTSCLSNKELVQIAEEHQISRNKILMGKNERVAVELKTQTASEGGVRIVKRSTIVVPLLIYNWWSRKRELQVPQRMFSDALEEEMVNFIDSADVHEIIGDRVLKVYLHEVPDNYLVRATGWMAYFGIVSVSDGKLEVITNDFNVKAHVEIIEKDKVVGKLDYSSTDPFPTFTYETSDEYGSKEEWMRLYLKQRDKRIKNLAFDICQYSLSELDD